MKPTVWIIGLIFISKNIMYHATALNILKGAVGQKKSVDWSNNLPRKWKQRKENMRDECVHRKSVNCYCFEHHFLVRHGNSCVTKTDRVDFWQFSALSTSRKYSKTAVSNELFSPRRKIITNSVKIVSSWLFTVP